jgi:hypothetical protein
MSFVDVHRIVCLLHVEYIVVSVIQHEPIEERYALTVRISWNKGGVNMFYV